MVWVGTRTAGLHQVRPRPVRTYYLPPSARQQTLLTVCIARNGGIWGGTDGAGVFCWRGAEPSGYGRKEGLTNLHVAALLEDSRSNLWAGTLGGLFRLRAEGFEPEPGGPRDCGSRSWRCSRTANSICGLARAGD